MNTHSISPIGWVSSPYKEKFGAPRQPNEVDAAVGYLHLHQQFQNPNGWRGIEGFSHVWVLFQFHQAVAKEWKPTVRPPRLGGNQRVGVFASRSPFRQNSIGMSVLKNLGLVEHPTHGLSLQVSGLDLIDDTPIYDIKPYILHADCIPEAQSGFSPLEIAPLSINWKCHYQGPHKDLIEQTLQLDPRPAYKEDGLIHGCKIHDLNIRWQVAGQQLTILEIT